MKEMLERLFQIRERGSSYLREILGGIVTFMTMAYIISVQPKLMSQFAPNWTQPGDEIFFSIMVATCLLSAIGCLFMAFLANYPVSLAPGMGMNVMFAIMVGSLVTTPQIAIGVIFWSGLLFFIITFLKLQRFILNLVNPSLQSAIVVGIGLFILTIGVLYMFHDSETGQSGFFSVKTFFFFFPFDERVFTVFIINLAVIVLLMVLRIPGALFLGMIIGTVVGSFYGIIDIGQVVAPVPSFSPTFFQIDFLGALQWVFIPYIAIFLFVDMFDTMATLIGVTRKAKLVDEDGTIPRASGALKADAIGTLGGSFFAISPVTSYIESSAGVITGARTGLATIVSGILFILAIFFTPLWYNLSSNVIIGPALIVVGFLMMSELENIHWDDWSEAVPAVLIMTTMVGMTSITWGLATAFVTYPLCKVAAGKMKELNWLNWLMLVISAVMLVLLFNSF